MRSIQMIQRRLRNFGRHSLNCRWRLPRSAATAPGPDFSTTLASIHFDWKEILGSHPRARRSPRHRATRLEISMIGSPR